MLSHFRPSSLLALVLLGTAVSAQAKVVSSNESGFVIENSVIVPTDPQVSWRALVESVGQWWPADHTWFGRSENLRIEPRAGGCFCEISGDRQVVHMTIGFVDPGVRLRMLGGLGPLQGMGMYGALDWTFEKSDGGTRITLRYQAGGYAGPDLAAMLPVIDQVQGVQLGGLGEFLRKAHAPAGQ
jgi:hypothetical protein